MLTLSWDILSLPKVVLIVPAADINLNGKSVNFHLLYITSSPPPSLPSVKSAWPRLVNS